MDVYFPLSNVTKTEKLCSTSQASKTGLRVYKLVGRLVAFVLFALTKQVRAKSHFASLILPKFRLDQLVA